jgi:hypothetical protein
MNFFNMPEDQLKVISTFIGQVKTTDCIEQKLDIVDKRLTLGETVNIICIYI